MMAGTDAAGVNERLNGLVTLLQSVGIDGLDSNALLEQQKRKGSSNKSSKKKASSTIDNSATGNDAQILEIVKKLQQAQAETPEILEALKSPELLALASLAAQSQKQTPPEPPKPAAPSLDDVMDDDDDNYPKIGPGYSDDISVVSELSTPTVMTRQSVSDEEYYREVKAGGQGVPPSSIGAGGIANSRLGRNPRANIPNRVGLGAGKLNAGKTKNMVGQIRPMATRRPVPAIPAKTGGGAAAQRRLNYQMAMSKLESDGFGSPTPDVSKPIPPINGSSKEVKKQTKSSSRNASGSRSIGSGSGGGSKRKPRSINSKSKNNSDEIDWGMADEDGWPTFDDPKSSSSKNELFVDSDGFFSDNVFASNDAVTSSTKTRRKKGEKSVSARSTDGSTNSGSKKKGSREERATRKSQRTKKDRESERALSDDDREGSIRKSHRLKKGDDKDSDALSDDGLGTSRKPRKSKKDKDRDKDKSGRRKARRATMQT